MGIQSSINAMLGVGAAAATSKRLFRPTHSTEKAKVAAQSKNENIQALKAQREKQTKRLEKMLKWKERRR